MKRIIHFFNMLYGAKVAELGGDVDLLATHIFLLHIVLFPVCACVCLCAPVRFCLFSLHFPMLLCALVFRYVMNFQRKATERTWKKANTHTHHTVGKEMNSKNIRSEIYTKMGLP